MKNKYIKRSRISEAKFREVLKYFSFDLDASKTAKISGLNRNTINKIFHGIRQRIFLALQIASEKFSGEIELDESYFGARRIRGKRGRELLERHLCLEF